MLFDTLNIPTPILDAQADGRLVIFVGAGISRDAPSSLPDFKGLADQLSAGSGVKYDPDKYGTIDQFLGRLYDKLKENNIDLHARARKLLSPSDKRPNDYHKTIPKLFINKNDLRIVSTNQDPFLQNGIVEIHGEVDVFTATALPVGDDFDGLVYVHGSTQQEPRRMVLTDKDFSKAYLTEGWALRFLQKLFEKYTVLFIGYSLNDTVLQYLARGLPVDKGRRYALISSNSDTDRDNWSHRGISPISYEPPAVKGQPHENLIIGLQQWAHYTSSGIADHRSRITKLAEGAPVELGEDFDYLERQLKDPDYLILFVQKAIDPKWIEWADRHGFLAPLFSTDKILDDQRGECAGLWAVSLVEFGIEKGFMEVFHIARKYTANWNSILWYHVVRGIHSTDDLPHYCFNQWVMALLAAPIDPGGTHDFLGYPIMKCEAEERYQTAVMIFDMMTHPIPKIEKQYSTHKDDHTDMDWDHLRWDTLFIEKDYWLIKAWEKIFKPNLSYFTNHILPLAEANLLRAHNIVNHARSSFVGFEHHRYEIVRAGSGEVHSYNGVVDILIDAIRDCLCWLAENKPEESVGIIHRYLSSGHKLFQRVALYVLHNNTALINEDEIAKLLLDYNLIAPGKDSGELGSLVKGIYPNISEEVRAKVLDQVDAYIQDVATDNESEWKQHSRLQWIRMLAEAAPGSAETVRRWEEAKRGILEEKLPSGVPGMREGPRVFHWSPISPYSKDELLELDAATIFAKFDDLPKDDFFNKAPDRKSLEYTARELSGENIEFGIKICKFLAKQGNYHHPFWEAIYNGWRSGSPNNAQWKEIINLLEQNQNAFKQMHHNMAELIKSSVEKESGRISKELLPRMEALSDRLWDQVKDSKDIIRPDDDVLTLAINSTAGILTQFWLHCLSWIRKDAEDNWVGLPDEYKKRFGQIVSGDCFGSQMGKGILASQLHFLAYLDLDWCCDEFMRLYDYEANEATAARSWSAFAWQVQLSPTVIELTRPFLTGLFDNLDKLNSNEKEGLASRIAGMAYYEGETWKEDGLLNRFVIGASEDLLSNFTRQLGYGFNGSNEEFKKESWNGWLCDYISNRKNGIPKPFSNKETESLAEWVFAFEFMANEFINELVKLPCPDMQQSSLIRNLADSNLAEKFPPETLQLLAWLLRGAKIEEYWDNGETLNIVEKLVATGLDKLTIREAIEDQCQKLRLHPVFDYLK